MPSWLVVAFLAVDFLAVDFLAVDFLAVDFFAVLFLAGVCVAVDVVAAAGATALLGPNRDTKPSSWSSRSSTRLASHPSCLATSACTTSARRVAVSLPRSSSVCTVASVSERRTSPAFTAFLTADSACFRDISVNWTPDSISFCRVFPAIRTC